MEEKIGEDKADEERIEKTERFAENVPTISADADVKKTTASGGNSEY
jgi:hypothetical protein